MENKKEVYLAKWDYEDLMLCDYYDDMIVTDFNEWREKVKEAAYKNRKCEEKFFKNSVYDEESSFSWEKDFDEWVEHEIKCHSYYVKRVIDDYETKAKYNPICD